MAEILLVRHAQSYANVRDFTAFGNEDSPLTDKAISKQIPLLINELNLNHNIVTTEYSDPVLSSAFTRTQQTAKYAGFENVNIDPLINESDVDREIASGNDVIKKHALEHWAPDETKERAARFIDLVQKGELGYQIYFSHGMFIASVALLLDDPSINFDEKRGYVPLQASITPMNI